MTLTRQYALYFVFLIARVFLFPLYLFSGVVHRRPDLWVFGSWGGYRFSDNSAAFFLHCQEEFADSVRLVWISRTPDIVEDLREKGYEAHYTWSVRGIWCCLRARLYIFDSFVKDINFWTSRGASKINLWSGVPLKAFERDIRNPRSRYFRLFHGSLPERWFLAMMMPWHVDKPDLIIATSPETARITQRAFDLGKEAVVVTGFPRNDVLFRSPEEDSSRGWPESFRNAVDSGRCVCMYLPTYRDSGQPYFDVDWIELDQLMEQLNATFFFKFHPDDTNTFRGTGRHIVELETDADIYSMLRATDILVSDYSSIIFDYMLLDRPVIYYVPDLDEFTASSRSLIFDPSDIAVGPVCSSGETLMSALSDTVNGFDATPEVRARWSAIRTRFNTYADGQSSRRTEQAIVNRMVHGHAGRRKVSIGKDPTTEN